MPRSESLSSYEDGGSSSNSLFLVFLLLLAGGAAYVWNDEEHKKTAIELWEGFFPPEPVFIHKKKPKLIEKTIKVETLAPGKNEGLKDYLALTQQDPLKLFAGKNPYALLPNPRGSAAPNQTVWSAKEESEWRTLIKHKWAWQRYKTVLDIHQKNRKGSQVVLLDALSDSQFWIRMRALAALADLGLDIPKDADIAKGLGSARPSLMANYFKRFFKNSSIGERHVMRASLKEVDPSVRQQILQTLKLQNIESENEIYLVAATFDSSPLVRNWAERQVARIPKTQLEAYKDEIIKLNFSTLPQISLPSSLGNHPGESAPDQSKPALQPDEIEILNLD